MEYLSVREFDRLTVKEQIKYIDSMERWDDLDNEGYEHLCNYLGLDYWSFDDPFELFDAIIEAYENNKEKEERFKKEMEEKYKDIK